MAIEETLEIRAPAGKIWETMLDVPFLLSSIPGVKKVEAIDDSTYSALLEARVAFITATFDMEIVIVNRQEPTYLEVKGEGRGRMGAGRMTFNQAVTLKPVSEEETEVTYKIQLNVIGRLATLGGKAIPKTVNEASEAFRKAFVAKCEGI